MRLIDADKLETTAVLGVQLQHADSRYYYFYEEDTIEKAPTVKAIPVEYIEAFKKKVRHIAPAKEVIDWLLEEWGKENETN